MALKIEGLGDQSLFDIKLRRVKEDGIVNFYLFISPKKQRASGVLKNVSVTLEKDPGFPGEMLVLAEGIYPISASGKSAQSLGEDQSLSVTLDLTGNFSLVTNNSLAIEQLGPLTFEVREALSRPVSLAGESMVAALYVNLAGSPVVAEWDGAIQQGVEDSYPFISLADQGQLINRLGSVAWFSLAEDSQIQNGQVSEKALAQFEKDLDQALANQTKPFSLAVTVPVRAEGVRNLNEVLVSLPGGLSMLELIISGGAKPPNKGDFHFPVSVTPYRPGKTISTIASRGSVGFLITESAVSGDESLPSSQTLIAQVSGIVNARIQKAAIKASLLVLRRLLESEEAKGNRSLKAETLKKILDQEDLYFLAPYFSVTNESGRPILSLAVNKLTQAMATDDLVSIQA